MVGCLHLANWGCICLFLPRDPQPTQVAVPYRPLSSTNCPGLLFEFDTFPCFSPCRACQPSHSAWCWQGTSIAVGSPCQPVHLTASVPTSITESLRGVGAEGHREEV